MNRGNEEEKEEGEEKEKKLEVASNSDKSPNTKAPHNKKKKRKKKKPEESTSSKDGSAPLNAKEINDFKDKTESLKLVPNKEKSSNLKVIAKDSTEVKNKSNDNTLNEQEQMANFDINKAFLGVNLHKEKGNQFFNYRKMDSAENEYTQAIEKLKQYSVSLPLPDDSKVIIDFNRRKKKTLEFLYKSLLNTLIEQHKYTEVIAAWNNYAEHAEENLVEVHQWVLLSFIKTEQKEQALSFKKEIISKFHDVSPFEQYFNQIETMNTEKELSLQIEDEACSSQESKSHWLGWVIGGLAVTVIGIGWWYYRKKRNDSE